MLMSISFTGKDGCVLIDVLENSEVILEALDAFGKVLDKKPILAIILTHFHTDHSYGIEGVLERYPDARVFAHKKFRECFDTLITVRGPITYKRGMFQFGNFVSQHVNAGIGRELKYVNDFKIFALLGIFVFHFTPDTTIKFPSRPK